MSVWAYKTKDGRRYRAKFWHQGESHEKKGFFSRDKALEWEVNEKKKLREPPPPIPTTPTPTPSISFHELATKYLLYCRPRMRKNTWRAKAKYYREFIAWRKGEDIAVDQITGTLLNDYLTHIQEKYGSKRANRDLKDIKAMFSWGMRQEGYGVIINPCRYVEGFPEDPFVKYVPPLEDIDAVLLAAKPDEMDIIKAVYHSFGRIGEILLLKWEDVNFQGRFIKLWTRKRRRGELRAQIKPMNDTLHEVLMRKWKTRDKEEPWVFLNPRTGKAYSQRPRWMRRICERAGVKPFEFHSIRHAVAHYLDDTKKASLRQIRDLLGHERTTTTDIYLQSMSSDLMEPASLLEEREQTSVIGSES